MTADNRTGLGRRVSKAALVAIALVALMGSLSVSVEARAVSTKVQNACGSDYSRFCSAYAIGSSKARKCMRSNGRRLSRRCLRALVDAGRVPRSALRKRRRSSRR